MAGFEDARLAALGALAAASGVAPAAEGSDATSAHLQALETALLPLLEQSPDLPAAGFSPRNAGLAFLEQVVKVAPPPFSNPKLSAFIRGPFEIP